MISEPPWLSERQAWPRRSLSRPFPRKRRKSRSRGSPKVWGHRSTLHCGRYKRQPISFRSYVAVFPL